MRKNPVRVRDSMRGDVERRLADGESLRSIARSIGCCYQTLQYWRDKWDLPKLKPATVTGPDHPNWRGGVTVDRYGYRLVYTPGRKVHPYSYEHVVVAERMIGRRLRRREHVHHVNGEKLDNRPENLIVLPDIEHKRLHGQLERVSYELLRRGVIVFRDGQYQIAP